jgi:hemoglobin-like flavoprotein
VLTDRQRALVRETWAMVAPIAPTASALFYERLFDLDPSLRRLFAHADMDAQREKLMQMLAAAVAHLDRLDTLAPAVEGLGRRHAGYGVRDADYATVRDALLWTLERGLGAAFTAEARAAWTTTYELLVGIMRSAFAGRGVAPVVPVVRVAPRAAPFGPGGR